MSAFETFRRSLTEGTGPGTIAPELAALWHDGRGDWDGAHRTVQPLEGADAAWVHAYLHRKEGDLANAAYWYRRAGREPATAALEAEWEAIARALLRDPTA